MRISGRDTGATARPGAALLVRAASRPYGRRSTEVSRPGSANTRRNAPSLGREKIVRKFTIWAVWTSRTPNKSHTRTPRCTALPTEALQPPSKRERGSSSRRRTAPKNKKNHPVQKPTMSLDLRTTDTLSCNTMCVYCLYHWAINPFTA
jgi:hypothetical protein